MNPTGAIASSEHYEALRQRAVAGRQIFPTDPLGAILVVKTGVAGWLRQWRQVCGEIIVAPSRPAPRSAIAPGWQHELTLLLAHMSAPPRRPSLSP